MEKWIPSSSQTVGPFFRIGLEYLIDGMAGARAGAEGWVEIRGRVLDRDGAPVPDSLLEFWSAGLEENQAGGNQQERETPRGFRRVATDAEGCFAVRMERPVASHLEDGRVQAPHAMVLVFARGLLRHLIARVYLEGSVENEKDPVLLGVPAERRGTLIAKHDGADVYRWDVILQGANETVFFAW